MNGAAADRAEAADGTVLRDAARRAALLLAVVAAGLFVLYLLFGDRDAMALGLMGNFLAVTQDLPAVPIVVAALLFLPIGAAWAGIPILPPGPWLVPLAAGLATLVGIVGGSLVFQSYPLSLDEFMAEFDAAILAEGRLTAALDPAWRGVADALQPIFAVHTPAKSEWVSGYLPVNAALRAALGSVGLQAWTSPLLAGVAMLALFGVARKLLPGKDEAAIAAVLLVASSAQFLITAMTPYAMTGHLAFNLIWLWLALHGRPWSLALALLVSFIACGLHQAVFHPVFAAPLLVWLWWEGRRRAALLLGAGLAAVALFWLLYPGLIGVVPPPLPSESAMPTLPERIATLMRAALDPATPVLMVENLLRFFTWQNPMLLLLLGALPLAWKRLPPVAWALLAGPALMLVLVILLMPSQGHGWGYRYLHGFLGSFALVAILAWQAILATRPDCAKPLGRALSLSLLLSCLVLLPLRAWQAGRFAAPHAAAQAGLQRIDTDVILLDGLGRHYAIDLVRNDPFLRNRPLLLSSRALSAGELRTICSRFDVVVLDASSPELAMLRPIGEPGQDMLFADLNARLENAGCLPPRRPPPLPFAPAAFTSAPKGAGDG